jgi:hypothetical protein
VSRFASLRFRHVLAILLTVCWAGDAVALGLVVPRSPAAAVAFVLSLCVLAAGITACVHSRDEPDSGEEGGDGPGGNGGGGSGRPRGPDPFGGPAWWPQFERDFREYVEERRTPLRTP